MKMRYLAILALTAVALGLAGVIAFHFAYRSGSPQVPEQKPGASTPHPQWAVHPSRPGSDHPPVGRSLFDFIATRERAGQPVYDIPFPFEALLQRVNERAGCAASAPCVRAVLIPLGRSLQRLAAAPDFFRHPRIVAAVDGEGDRAMALLKDRLYLGYQQQAGMLEVISYNEAAGRFEFQRVHNYRAGATPRVSYARREVCAACHQNLAPIFSRPLWAETNANPRIAAALAQHRDAFAGVAVQRGIDIPDAIDAASDRANLLGVWQRLWREGCGGDDAAGRRCRGAAVLAALQYRLGSERGFDEATAGWRDDLLPTLARQWRARWPAGLAIPNPDLPSRDPLQTGPATPPAGVALAHVPAMFEPLLPRPPLETWALDSDVPASAAATQLQTIARRYVAGLGSFFTHGEIRALDRQLHEHVARNRGQRRQYRAECTHDSTGTSLRFRCDRASSSATAQLSVRLSLRGNRIGSGVVDGLAVVGGAPLHHVKVSPGVALDARGTELRLHDDGRHVRLADGAVVEAIELRWHDPAAVEAIVRVVDDLAPLRDAITALADDADRASPLSTRPFNRARLTAALFARLDMDGRTACCDDGSRLPSARIEPAAPPAPTQGPAQPFAAFYPMCAGCHATGEHSPPNFLAGSGAQVVAKLRHCAPRLYARLAMWRRDPGHREKTPMPPPFASVTAAVARPPHEAEALEAITADLLRAETGRVPQLDALLVDGYESLRPCLPAAAG